MGKKILVVDDDPVIRSLVTEYLTNFGHTIQSADSGALALDRLSHEKPDIVILDMMMPEMNGAQVLDRMRRDPNTAKLPIIMLSANNDIAEMVSANTSAHADCYLQKPFVLREVLLAIEELSSNSKADDFVTPTPAPDPNKLP